jgi:hypothetical protein
MAAEPDDALTVAWLRRGSLHLRREACAAFFPQAESVALIEGDGTILVIPLVVGAAGGLLLKVRNARGDRVVQAQEFFRRQGFDDMAEAALSMRWDAARAALVLQPATARSTA